MLRIGRWMSGLLLSTATAVAGAAAPGALPAQAAGLACGLPEIDQNVFMPGGNGEGSWTNPVLWSKGHTPRAGDVAVCVPGGTVGLVTPNPANPGGSVELIGQAVDHVTTLRIEGTIRLQGGVHAATANIYGGHELINAGVIQVLDGSQLDLAPDQNAAHPFQNVGNVVGGGKIQVQGGSRLYLRRPLLNNGTIDVTGGGKVYAAFSSSTSPVYSGTGSVVGGQLLLTTGIVEFTKGGGSLSVRGGGDGGISGTIGANQSVDVSCDTSSGGIVAFGDVVNNGVVRFRPPTAGNCGIALSMYPLAGSGGPSFTNNGRFEVGDPNVPKGFGYYGATQSGSFVNGPSGKVVLYDTFTDANVTRNDGLWTVGATGTYLNNNLVFTNNGTFVNANGCEVRSLANNGVLDLVKSCAVWQNSTFGASSTLRLHASASGITKVTGGDRASTIAGTLDVVTDAASPPAIGTVSDILETGATGTFAAVTSSTAGYTYGANYPSGGRPQVTLLSFTPGGGGNGGGGGGGGTGGGGDGDGGGGTGGGGGGDGDGSPAITALNPGRLLDTRSGGTTVDGASQGVGLLGADATVELQVAGRSGVPADASAAVLNVTVTDAQGAGYVTVWPCGTDRPNASSLNFVAGSTVANGVIAKIGDGGKVCLYVSDATQLLADVAGYFPAVSPYRPLNPSRVLDTRPGGATADGQGQGGGPAGAGSVTEVPIVGRAGVPGEAAAVVLNVTVTDASDAGYVTVFPCGTTPPNASNLNYVTGSTVPNNVVAKVGDGGTICLFTSSATHLLTDVAGWFAPSASFQPLEPARLLDTRAGGSTVDGAGQGIGAQPAGATVEVQVGGRAGVPGDATAAVLNVTVTDAQGAGYVTVWPCGTDRPNASSLNYVAGSTVPNGVIAKIGEGGKVCLYVSEGAHLLTDVAGWFGS